VGLALVVEEVVEVALVLEEVVEVALIGEESVWSTPVVDDTEGEGRTELLASQHWAWCEYAFARMSVSHPTDVDDDVAEVLLTKENLPLYV